MASTIYYNEVIKCKDKILILGSKFEHPPYTVMVQSSNQMGIWYVIMDSHSELKDAKVDVILEWTGITAKYHIKG